MKKTLVLVSIFVLLAFVSKIIFFKYQAYKLAIKQMEMQENILDGVTAQPVVVKVDYSKQVAKGSPLVFGGAHTPPVTHTDAWKKISDVGVTSIRNDLFLEFTLPRNITVEDYISNKNDVRNVAKWDQKTIGSLQTTFALAKKSGMKTIGIVGYAPRWLTYNGTAFGVPKNWDVFEDIVKKDYKLYRNNLDYLEIWNEPDHRIFLVTDKSNLTKAEAYKLIYSHAVKAIREVDKEMNDGKNISIGAPAESNAKLSNILTSLVSDASLSAKPDFLSFHAYDISLMNSSLEKYRDINSQYLSITTPIFVTEWNNEMQGKDDENSKTGNLAIPYTANNLITYLQNGISGANYFGLLPINSTERGTDEKTMGFYRWNNGQAELLPQAKTWRLMSKTLALGAGESKIMETSYDSSVNAVGAVNSSSQRTLAIANTSTAPQLVEMQLNNINIQKRALVYIYVASRDYDGAKPIRNEIAEVKNGHIKTRFYMPQESVAGIKIIQFSDKWFDLFDVIAR